MTVKVEAPEAGSGQHDSQFSNYFGAQTDVSYQTWPAPSLRRKSVPRDTHSSKNADGKVKKIEILLQLLSIFIYTQCLYT